MKKIQVGSKFVLIALFFNIISPFLSISHADIGDVGHWRDGAGNQIPGTTFGGFNFNTQVRNDGIYSKPNDSTIQVSEAGDYLIIATTHDEDSSNGRYNSQLRISQTAGAGQVFTSHYTGYSRDTSENESWTRAIGVVVGASANSQFQIQKRRDTDAPTGGSVANNSDIQVIRITHTNHGIYGLGGTGNTYGGTTENTVDLDSVVSQTDTSSIEGNTATETITLKGDNKKYLVAWSTSFTTGAERTQRIGHLEYDGVDELSTRSYCYSRSAGNEYCGLGSMDIIQTSTADIVLQTEIFRGPGVAVNQGGADDDGNLVTDGNGQIIILELPDEAEGFRSEDSTGLQDLTAAQTLNIARDVNFNDAASFTKASNTNVSVTNPADVFSWANVWAARNNVATGLRFTGFGSITLDGAEQSTGRHGSYSRGNQGVQDAYALGFQPAGIYTTTTPGVSLGVNTDPLAGGEGGGTDRTQPGTLGFFALNLDTITNSIPTDIILSNDTIDENVAANTIVGTFTTIDENPTDIHTYSLVAGTGDTDNAAFTMSGSNLSINSSPDFETQASYSIRVQTDDGNGGTYEEVFAITINDLLETPTLTSLRDAIGKTPGIYNFDISGTIFSSFVDANGWVLVASGEGVTDETSYTQVTNLTLQSDQILTSTIVAELTDTKEVRMNADVGVGAPLDVSTANTTIISRLLGYTTIGYDVDNNTNGWTGTGAGELTTSCNGGSAALDTKIWHSCGITGNLHWIQSTNLEGIQHPNDDSDLNLWVRDANDIPTGINLTNNNLDENVAASTIVGVFSSVDANPGDTHSYSLVSGVGDIDNSAFTISGDTLSINASPDFEVQASYSIRVQTDDGNGGTYEEISTITINDLDEVAPVITLTGPNPVSVVKNASYTDSGATCTDDVDATCSVAIGGATVDTTTLGSYVITYDVTDAAGNNATQVTRTVNVIAGDVPVITLSGSVSETVEVNSTYTDAGATAADTEDGDITLDIVMVNPVNTSATGSYTVTYDVTDSSDNDAIQVTRTVNVVDSTPPVLSLTGTGLINVVKNSSYSDAGATASDSFEGNITADIVTVNPVDTSVLGTYTITYNVSDSSGNAATQVTRTVNVISGNTPIISLLGSNVVTHEVNTVYTDEGATATDTEDGDITADILTVNPVDTSTLGTYTVTYDVTDSSDNNAIQVTRTVHVVDTIAPVITLTGSDPINLTQGDSYSDPGATCSDNFDVSCSVVVGGDSVDTTRVGIYVVEYDAVDTSGNNAIQVTRTINVVAAPLLINEVEYDTPGNENEAEWFEIYNPTSGTVNIENWTITEAVGTTSSKTYTFGSYDIPAGGYIVVTNETIDFQLIYPGITPDIDLPGTQYFNLKNSPSDELELKDPNGNNIDFVRWEDTAGGWDLEAIDLPICRLLVADTDTDADWSDTCVPTPQAVNQFNAIPTDIALSSQNIDENNSASATIGIFSTTDADVGDTHTYTLVAGAGDTDNASFSLSGNSLLITPIADYETKQSYNIRIATNDGNGGVYEEAFIINVNDINLAPTDIALTSEDIDENNSAGDTIGTLSGTDDGEDTNTLTFALACSTPGTDDGNFSISGTNLNAAAVYDYETKDTYNICIRVSDGVLSYDENFVININNLDEVAPLVVITPVTKLQNSSITDTTIQITDDVAVNAVDISISTGSTASASALSCTQTSATQVDCTISIDSSGDLVIDALDASNNSGSDTETNYIIDTIPPNVPTVNVDTTFPYDIDNPELTFSSLDNVGVDYYTVTYSADDGGAGTGTLTTINPAMSPVVLNLDPDEGVVHTIVVTVYDAAGNTSSTTISFPPIITINAPTTISNATITDSTVTITTPSGNDIINVSLSSPTTGASLGTCTDALGGTAEPYFNPVTCIINNIAASGTIEVQAEDSALGAQGRNSQSYIIDMTPPVVSITAPTKLDNAVITDTTIVVTDETAVNLADVSVALSSTVTSSSFSCTQTSPSRVDCTIQVDDSGDLVISADDVAGNNDTETEANYIIDTTQPVLSLIVPSPETVEYLSTYNDGLAEYSDNVDGTGSIVGLGSVNTGVLGTYVLTYDYTDAAGNPATQISRTVEVVDTTIPVISLIGNSVETIEVGTIYTDAGATATDNFDGNLTGSISATGSVDTFTLGTYTLYYDVTDSNGNIATQVTRSVEVVDTTIPVISLTGLSEIVLEVGSTYSEPGATATDNYDTILPGSIVIDSSAVDTNTVGSYIVTYDVIDSSGNSATQVTRTVTVEDTTAPIISLIGTGVTVEVNTSYIDAGATCTDNYDISCTTTDVNPVDITAVGTYVVTYDVTDSNGNIATEVIRTVEVVTGDTPIITLNGNAIETVEVNTSYIDAGAIASDSEDGNISASIVTVNPIDITATGSYVVSYDVTDSSDNIATQVTRTVNVVDTTAPTILLTGTGNVTLFKNATYTEFGAICSDNYDTSCSVTIAGDSVDTSILGTYTITYNVTDSNSNVASEVIRTVEVVTGDTPIITLNGNAIETVEVNTSYIDAGAIASDREDGNISASIVTVNPVDITATGSYVVSYNVTDSSDNIATQVTRTVNVVDTTAPTILLTGTGNITLFKNATYTEFGAICSDNYDTSCSVIIAGDTVDTSILGTYTVTYDVTDTSDNTATQVTRTVEVISGDIPVITLTGSGTINHEVNTPYNDVGATASDSEDGNISASIVTVNPVDITATGSYVVSYDVTDFSDNSAIQVTRTVNVVDTTAPVITLTGNASETVNLGDAYTDAGATCSDNYDVACTVIINNPVDVNALGVYTITYDVTDANGNIATQVTRTVNVVSGDAPVITLLGNAVETVVLGDGYIDAGATANDLEDGDISGNIVVNNPVDTSTIGVYTVTYDVIDSNSNSALQVSRTVNVIYSLTDSDGDGVSDAIEAIIGTDPNIFDTDGDGLSDSNNDGDNVSPGIEIGASNNGDANGDGQIDAIQRTVSSIPNIENSQYNSLEIQSSQGGICGQIDDFESVSEGALGSQDTNYNYQLGLWDFEIRCDTPGSTANLQVYLDKEYDTSNWVYRKYNDATGAYTDISSIVSYTTETVGANEVTVVNYSITDGGIYDEDGIANGVIIDPSGPAIRQSGASGEVVYDRCDGNDTSGDIYDGLCGDEGNEDFSENTQLDEEILEEENNDTETEVIIDENSIDVTIENSFETCPIINDIQNPLYSYRGEIYSDTALTRFESQIDKFSAIGIVDGYDDGTFKPFREMSRAEFLKVALISHCYTYRELEGITEYSDVEENTWQARVIQKAESLGMINGDITESGVSIFRPDDIISKAEAIKILMRISRIQAQETSTTLYSDITVEWHKKYVENGEALGLFNAESDNYEFNPDSGVQRQDMVDLISRLIELYE